MQEKDFFRRLRSTYKHTQREAEDVFGRRTATPNEIARAIDTEVEFPEALEHYLPDETDLEVKEDTGR